MKHPPFPFPLSLFFILIFFFLPTPSMADPRTQTVQVKCSRQFQHNSTFYQPNYSAAMFNLSNQLQSSRFGVAASGSSPDASFSLFQCYGDLANLDCQLCFSESRSLLPQCFPSTGGLLFLDGCFLRSDNYSFFSDISGPSDGPVCSNSTTSAASPAFRTAANQAVASAVNAAVNGGLGFGRSSSVITGNGSSVYALANCWESLNGTACSDCLMNASTSALACLPAPEGRGLMAGCFLRYSDFDFLNKDPNKRRSKSKNPNRLISNLSGFIILIN